MIVSADRGPVGSPTSKDSAGFLARTCLRHSASAGERAERSLPVIEGLEDPRGRTIAEGDVLRWYPHPVLDASLTWGAMWTALDLVFTDGTRLSQLDPRDQYGMPATAEGLGASEVLFPDQWNDVQVDLSAAVGRTIEDVLLVVAPPAAADAPDADSADPGATAPSTAGSRVDGELVGWIDGPYVGPLPADPPIEDPVAWVDTRRGTNASGDFSRGNNLPLTAWPNGFVFVTPATDARSERWVYEYHRCNGDDNRPRLQAIALSHEPSPWMGDRNQLMVMPLLGADPDASPAARARGFDHAREVARPDRYEVALDGGIDLRLAPSDHGLLLEIDLPADAEGAHLLLEGVDEHSRIDASGAVLDGEISGWVDTLQARGADEADGATRMFVHATVDPQPIAVRRAEGATPGAARLSFADGTTRVTLRLVTSFIGIQQARRTFAQELAGRDLAQLQKAAHDAWMERLAVIDVDGATAPQRRTLYGGLYRLNLYPNSQWENAGTLEAPELVHASPVLPTRGEATDTRTNAQVLPGKIHVNNGFWDTYRTAWPAYALLYPQLAAELADGFVQQYREGGWIARWSSPGYADCMTGTSSDIAFADLHVLGVPIPDPHSAYLSGLRNATVAPPHPKVGRKGNDRAQFTGYVDTDTDESVSWALEAQINDLGLAAQAELLAADHTLPESRRTQLREEAAYLRARSMNYQLLFDPAVGFFQARRRDGAFAQTPEQFDPTAWGGDFTETDGWNFAFHVPQDGEGLAALYGGREGLRAKLEEFFATPEKADNKGTYGSVIHEMVEARAVRMGQFGMSNQPSHHIPFLFHHAGAPERAMQIVREVQERLFVGEQIGQGYPGDEDNGEMSAWWILTALGLYPLQLASGRYHLVAPLFERVRVRPLGGEAFTITADGQGPGPRYITGMQVGGAAHTVAAIDHAALRGEVRIQLGQEPTGWGEAPPSPTAPGERPAALLDLLPRDASEPLLDDESTSQFEADSASPMIDLPVLDQAHEAVFYTLTSGAEDGGDPIAWRLEGSTDGVGWQLLDERTEQAFPWRRQTRPFQIQSPSACTHHRLTVITAQGPVRLSQVELLA